MENILSSDIVNGDELRYSIWRNRVINKLKVHGIEHVIKPIFIRDFEPKDGETSVQKKTREEALCKEKKADANGSRHDFKFKFTPIYRAQKLRITNQLKNSKTIQIFRFRNL